MQKRKTFSKEFKLEAVRLLETADKVEIDWGLPLFHRPISLYFSYLLLFRNQNKPLPLHKEREGYKVRSTDFYYRATVMVT